MTTLGLIRISLRFPRHIRKSDQPWRIIREILRPLLHARANKHKNWANIPLLLLELLHGPKSSNPKGPIGPIQSDGTIAARSLVNVSGGKVEEKIMRSRAGFCSMMVSLAIGGLLSGCFSSTKEVETVPAPAPVVQVPPPVVEVPPPVVVTPNSTASQTTTSTSWDNGTVQQRKTSRSVDGQVQNQTTTTWGNGTPSSETTTTTTTSP
jgi:hypothetical protein